MTDLCRLALGKYMIPAKLLELLKITHRYPIPTNAYSESQESGMSDGETTRLAGGREGANFFAWSLRLTHVA